MSNNYFVYCLFDPTTGVPRYIGKGGDCTGRWEWWLENYKIQGDRHACKWFRKLKRNNLKPLAIKVVDRVSEPQAFTWERGLIGLVGRQDKGEGPLYNHTDGGEGASGLRVSQYIGVYPYKGGWYKGGWYAELRANGRRYFRYGFKKEWNAAKAYDTLVDRYLNGDGQKNRVNGRG